MEETKNNKCVTFLIFCPLNSVPCSAHWTENGSMRKTRPPVDTVSVEQCKCSYCKKQHYKNWETEQKMKGRKDVYCPVTMLCKGNNCPCLINQDLRHSDIPLLTSALDTAEWSAPRPCSLIIWGRTLDTHWRGGRMGPRARLDDVKRKISCPCRKSKPNSCTVQRVASRYTDFNTVVHKETANNIRLVIWKLHT
jgi:hypothetical protein